MENKSTQYDSEMNDVKKFLSFGRNKFYCFKETSRYIKIFYDTPFISEMKLYDFSYIYMK